MTYTVGNAVTHSVTNDVRNDARTSVQNQNQNQTVFRQVCGGLLVALSFIHAARTEQGGHE